MQRGGEPPSNSLFLMYLLSSRSGVKHCMQLHKSYIGAAAAGLQRLVCLQEQKKKKKCKGHFMHSLVVFVKAAFSNLLPLFFPPPPPSSFSHMNCVTHILTLSNSQVLSSVLSFESSESSLFQHCPDEWCKDPPHFLFVWVLFVIFLLSLLLTRA